jgi:hypothetical protein
MNTKKKYKNRWWIGGYAQTSQHLMLFPLLSFFLLAANVETAAAAAVPTPWPEQFHAVLLTNLTGNGGQLELIDVYYDWPRGRTLNVVRSQLSSEPLYNVEWVNGSSYLFASSSASCTATWHRVGVLPPDWAHDAAYLGRGTVDGFECHVWSHPFFVRYYQDVATGRPVFWNFVGSSSYFFFLFLGIRCALA